MKQFLLLPILLAAVASVRGASLIEGRIYLKNGSVIECVGDDRLQLPKRFGKLTILRDAFRKTKAKEIFQSGEIDSVVCWHAQSPEHIRKFIPAESPGWMWVYLETPHICVCIYSEKGYGIDSNGGIQVWQRQGTFSQSRTAYYLKKTGEKEFLTVGAANRNTKDVFRERIARYVGDDPELAERIRLSSAIRMPSPMEIAFYFFPGLESYDYVPEFLIFRIFGVSLGNAAEHGQHSCSTK